MIPVRTRFPSGQGHRQLGTVNHGEMPESAASGVALCEALSNMSVQKYSYSYREIKVGRGY